MLAREHSSSAESACVTGPSHKAATNCAAGLAGRRDQIFSGNRHDDDSAAALRSADDGEGSSNKINGREEKGGREGGKRKRIRSEGIQRGGDTGLRGRGGGKKETTGASKQPPRNY